MGLDPREFCLKWSRTCPLLQFFDPSFIVGHLLANLIGMDKEVRQSRMNLRVIQLRKRGNDLIDGTALQFMPNVNVLNANARSCDSRLPATGVGRFDDLICKGRGGRSEERQARLKE